jgi:hypothetical protein
VKLNDLKAAVKAELRKALTWIKVGLLAALPFASDIKAVVAQNLPALQPYLPENIYKFMGAAVVITSMVLSLASTRRLLKAANESDNA